MLWLKVERLRRVCCLGFMSLVGNVLRRAGRKGQKMCLFETHWRYALQGTMRHCYLQLRLRQRADAKNGPWRPGLKERRSKG